MYNKVTIVVLTLLVLVLIHSTWNVYKKKRESENMKNISEKQVEELRTRNSELDTKLERIDTEEGIEEEIRSKFSVAKPDEKIVLVLEEEPVVATDTPKKGFWQSIWVWFGN